MPIERSMRGRRTIDQTSAGGSYPSGTVSGFGLSPDSASFIFISTKS